MFSTKAFVCSLFFLESLYCGPQLPLWLTFKVEDKEVHAYFLDGIDAMQVVSQEPLEPGDGNCAICSIYHMVEIWELLREYCDDHELWNEYPEVFEEMIIQSYLDKRLFNPERFWQIVPKEFKYINHPTKLTLDDNATMTQEIAFYLSCATYAPPKDNPEWAEYYPKCAYEFHTHFPTHSRPESDTQRYHESVTQLGYVSTRIRRSDKPPYICDEAQSFVLTAPKEYINSSKPLIVYVGTSPDYPERNAHASACLITGITTAQIRVYWIDSNWASEHRYPEPRAALPSVIKLILEYLA